MSIRQQAFIWVIALLVFILILWQLSSILMPFLVGMAIAYFLDPAADRLEVWGLSRIMATAVLFIGLFLIFVIGMLVIVPLLLNQISAFVVSVPETVSGLISFLKTQQERLLPERTFLAENELGQIVKKMQEVLADFSTTLIQRSISGGLAFVGFLAMLVITPVVAFYMLVDWDNMIEQIDDWLPREHAPVIRNLARQVDDVLAGFVRGQVSVCLILGSFYALSLSLIGLDYGLMVGLLAGFLSFIPYVGVLIGGALSMGLALSQFWGDWVSLGLVAGVFAIGQVVEGNYLTPKLVGGHVGLHPVWLMFALTAFGSVFGFVGLLIAVPAAAVIGVLGRFMVSQYQHSPLYHGNTRRYVRSDDPDDGGERV